MHKIDWHICGQAYIEFAMKTFCIYLPPDNMDNHSGAVFLPDDKPYFALLAPPIWLAWHRLWWALLIYLVIISAILLLILTPYRDAAVFISLIPGIYIWLEGHKLIHQRYELQGWIFQGVVGANSLDDAELKYYSYSQKNQSTVQDHELGKEASFAGNLAIPSSTKQSLSIFPVET